MAKIILSAGGGDYTTIGAWEAAWSLGAGAEASAGEIRDHAEYNETITFGGHATTATDYKWLRVADNYCHRGCDGVGHARISGNIRPVDPYSRIDRMAIYSGTGTDRAIYEGDSNVLVSRCLITGTTTRQGIYFHTRAFPMTGENTIIAGAFDSGSMLVGLNAAITFTGDFLTFAWGNNYGLRTEFAGASSDVYNMASVDTIGNWDYEAGVDGVITGNYCADSDNSIALDADITITNGIASITSANEFIAPEQHYGDWRLKSGGSLDGGGVDRSAVTPDARSDLSVDILGATRPATPSIGAFEQGSVPPGLIEQVLAAGAIEASTNLTGTVADVDDGDPASPDANWLTRTAANTDTDLRVSFATPNAAPSGAQIFYLQVRKDAAGGTDPTIDVWLYEGGTQLAQLISALTVSQDGGRIVAVDWHPDELTSSDGSGVELRARGNASVDRTVEIGLATWRAELAAGLLVGGLALMGAGR